MAIDMKGNLSKCNLMLQVERGQGTSLAVVSQHPVQELGMGAGVAAGPVEINDGRVNPEEGQHTKDLGGSDPFSVTKIFRPEACLQLTLSVYYHTD